MSKPIMLERSVRRSVRAWVFEGITFEAEADSTDILDLFEDALPFASVESTPSCGEASPHITLAVNLSSDWEAPGWMRNAETLYDAPGGRCKLLRVHSDPVVVIRDLGVARLDRSRRRIDIEGQMSLRKDPSRLVQILFMSLLGPALRLCSLLPLHASAVDWNGRAIVFPAKTGSGKSTLSLALVRGGFKLLADDMPILRREDYGWELLAFPEPVRVLPPTLAFFPEFAAAITDRGGTTSAKMGIDPTVVYPECYTRRSQPALIVMPRRTGLTHSSVHEASATDAVTELLSGVAFGSTGDSMVQQFPALTEFVRSCGVYRLDAGTDFDTLPGLMRQLLSA